MFRRILWRGVLSTLALVALFTIAPLAAAAPRAAETKAITIKDFKYDPAALTITVGDTITWTNVDAAPHTATASDKSFDSGRLNTGQSFSFTFGKAGTYQYVCTFHDRMLATIEVVEAAAAAPAPAPAAAPAQAAPTGSVEAADQPMVDGGIVVADVTSSVDGWIVVHLDEDGKPGKVLGFSPVKAGDNKNVAVKLSEDVPPGGGLWPMLHVDAGVAGAYEFPGADVPVRVNDAVVMKRIAVTAAPAALPRTGGEELPFLALAGGALFMLLAGAALRRTIRKA